ncbi:MAG: hypothetical protein IJ397_07210 [Lachnospiraceae bacterium]|nr:hypothetical protein [Lachnospiraceae bacterium]
MNKKFAELTVCDAFLLSKIMQNERVAKRFLEKITNVKVYKIDADKNNTVEYREGTNGIKLTVHIANVLKSIWKVELYILKEDIFGQGKSIYHFTEQCRGIPTLELQKGTHRIFICATQETLEKTGDAELQALVVYILNCEEKRSNLTKMLDDEVRRVKHNSIYVKEYQRMQQNDMEASQREFARRHQGKTAYTKR